MGGVRQHVALGVDDLPFFHVRVRPGRLAGRVCLVGLRLRVELLGHLVRVRLQLANRLRDRLLVVARDGLPHVAERRPDPIAEDLVPGELAVHRVHGVGRFVGIQRREVAGSERDYMVLEYADGDRLSVPTDQVGMVARDVASPDMVKSTTQAFNAAIQEKKAAEAAGAAACCSPAPQRSKPLGIPVKAASPCC